jgi:hypothetical protein
MPGIALPEEILQIIWRKVYSNNVASTISKHAIKINKNLQFNDTIRVYALEYNAQLLRFGYEVLSYSS